MSGRNEGKPGVEPRATTTPAVTLTVPATAAERLAELEAARDRERAAIQDLEADLRKAAGGRPVLNAADRFRRTVVLGFSLGALIVVGLLALLAELRR